MQRHLVLMSAQQSGAQESSCHTSPVGGFSQTYLMAAVQNTIPFLQI